MVKEGGVVLLETAYEPNETRSVMHYHGNGAKRFYNDISTWWIPSMKALEEMADASLLRYENDSAVTLRQDSQVGRIGMVLKPYRIDECEHSYAYEIANHYHTPLPRL